MGREQGPFPHFTCPYRQWSFHYSVHNLYYFVYMSGQLFIVGIPHKNAGMLAVGSGYHWCISAVIIIQYPTGGRPSINGE